MELKKTQIDRALAQENMITKRNCTSFLVQFSCFYEQDKIIYSVPRYALISAKGVFMGVIVTCWLLFPTILRPLVVICFPM